MSNPENRMFYLMLSALEGQKYANLMGYQPPSEEVQKMELVDVMSRWMLFTKIGIMDEVKDASTALIDFLQKIDLLKSPSAEFSKVLEAYSVSLINKILDKDLIGLAVSPSLMESLERALEDRKYGDDDIDEELSFDEFHDIIGDQSLFEDLDGEDFDE